MPLLRNAAPRSEADGRLGIVEFTKAGGGPGPPMDERVDPERVIREANEAGLRSDRAAEHPALSVHARVRQEHAARLRRAAARLGTDESCSGILRRTIRRESMTCCGASFRPTATAPIERSMAYTLFAPSKRVRPVLTQLSAEICGARRRRRCRRRGDRARAHGLAHPRRPPARWTTPRSGADGRPTTSSSARRSPSSPRSDCSTLAYGTLARGYEPVAFGATCGAA